jgi:glycerophosphoryl diester phosphodiesterase
MLFSTPLRPLIGAHRGASGEAPENTLAAFDLAVEQGAELLECDVHRSSDGHLMVQHDFSLNRTAGRDGMIGELSFEELRRCDAGAWRGEQWHGQPLPTLDEVLSRYGDALLINVEIKVDRQPYPQIEDLVARAVRMHNLYDRVVVSSFHLGTIERMRRIDPLVRTGLLADWRPDEAILHAHEVGALAVHLESPLITLPRLRQAQRWGLEVVAWTVDDVIEMVRLIDLRGQDDRGVAAIISNYPARLREVVLVRRASVSG